MWRKEVSRKRPHTASLDLPGFWDQNPLLKLVKIFFFFFEAYNRMCFSHEVKSTRE